MVYCTWYFLTYFNFNIFISSFKTIFPELSYFTYLEENFKPEFSPQNKKVDTRKKFSHKTLIAYKYFMPSLRRIFFGYSICLFISHFWQAWSLIRMLCKYWKIIKNVLHLASKNHTARANMDFMLLARADVACRMAWKNIFYKIFNCTTHF